MTHSHLPLKLLFVLLLLSLASFVLYGQGTPAISNIVTTPPAIISGSPASLTISANVTGTGLLPTSVTLIDISGAVPVLIRTMQQNGLGQYAATLSYATTPRSVRLEISASFAGTLRRVVTSEIDIPVIHANTIPATFSFPSPHAKTTDSAGNPIVANVILVLVADTVVDPDSTIRTIAAQSSAVVVGADEDLRTYQLLLPTSTASAAQSVAQTISSAPGVVSAQPDPLFQVDTTPPSTLYPNDPLWDSWTDNNPSNNNWGFKLIKAPQAWAITTGTRATKIGIIDLGVDTSHADLIGNIGITDSYFNSSASALHGTINAGIMAAVGNNGVGISGVDWTTTLNVYSLTDTVPLEFILAAMKQAAIDGNKAVNISLGTHITSSQLITAYNTYYQKVLNWTISKGYQVLWVVSAGNSSGLATFNSPAGLSLEYGNLVAVGSTSSSGTLSTFSNFGPAVTIAAPGENIYSTAPNQSYARLSGTSEAAPFVTGTAGLVFSIRPSLTPMQAKACLLATQNVISGFNIPMLDANAAVTCASRPPTSTFSMTAGTSSANNGQVLSLTVSLGGTVAVTFDGSSSSDPNGEAVVGWSWSINNLLTSSHPSFTESLPAGTYILSLVATNIDGVTSLAATGTVVIAQTVITSSVSASGTLDGAPWSGLALYSITCGLQSPVTSSALPLGSTQVGSVSLGTCTLSFSSGGPANATLTSVLPSSTQTVSPGSAVMFVLNFRSNPPTAGLTMSAGVQSVASGQTLNVSVASGQTATVNFDASASSAVNGASINSWLWQINGAQVSTAKMFTQVLSVSATPYSVSLVVTDSRGQQSSPAIGSVVVSGVATGNGWRMAGYDTSSTNTSLVAGPRALPSFSAVIQQPQGTLSKIGPDGSLYFLVTNGSQTKLLSYTNLGTLNWSVLLPGVTTDYSIAIAHGGTVVVSVGGVTLALDHSTGQTLWSYPVAGNTRLIIDKNDTLYFGLVPIVFGLGDVTIYALTPSGSLKWSYAFGTDFQNGLSGQGFGPVLSSDESTLYTISGISLGALDTADGHLKATITPEPNGAIRVVTAFAPWGSLYVNGIFNFYACSSGLESCTPQPTLPSKIAALTSQLYVGEVSSGLVARNPAGVSLWQSPALRRSQT